VVCLLSDSGANAGHFVGGDGNPDAGAADHDTKIGLFRDHSFAYGFPIVGVVYGLSGPSSLVVDGVSGGFEVFPDRLFDGESCVIGTDGDARDCIEEKYLSQFEKIWRSWSVSDLCVNQACGLLPSGP
jgi:hypothetical protein